MIDKLREIINKFPGENNYLRKIKALNKILYEWLKTQMPEIDDINEKIYLLLNKKDSCSHNNILPFLDYKRGYGYCARAEKCLCLQEKCRTTSKPLAEDQKKERTFRIKSTKKEIYGDENYNNRKKSIDTLIQNYGVTNPMFSADIKETLKKNVIEKYGVDNVAKLEDTKKNARNTNIKKYGKSYFTQTNEFKKSLKESVINKYPLRYIMYDIDKLSEVCKDSTPIEISESLGYANSSNLIQKFKKNDLKYKKGYIESKWQKEVYEFISQHYLGEIISGDRKILMGKELDIFIPSYNLAIECNGSYWHSELNGKDKNYHLNKTKLCKEKGIRLIHIWEHEWLFKRDIIESRLMSNLGKINKIGARKCDIIVLGESFNMADFISCNHIQGFVKSKINLGLEYNNEIVAVMTFGKSRYSQDIDFELLRFCNKLNTSVVGGASKLFRYFINNYMTLGQSILSYSDNNWNTGNVYLNIGFNYSHSSNPSYQYTRDYINFENRLKYQKHKLEKILPVFDKNLTEWQNMQNNGFDRIWNCGNDVWVWKNDK